MWNVEILIAFWLCLFYDNEGLDYVVCWSWCVKCYPLTRYVSLLSFLFILLFISLFCKNGKREICYFYDQFLGCGNSVQIYQKLSFIHHSQVNSTGQYSGIYLCMWFYAIQLYMYMVIGCELWWTSAWSGDHGMVGGGGGGNWALSFY